MICIPSSLVPSSPQTKSFKTVSHKSAFLHSAAIIFLALAIVPSILAQTYTVLSTFPQNEASVLSLQGSDGNFYGIELGTSEIGGGCGNPYGITPPCGAVFELTAGGTLTTVYDGFTLEIGGNPNLLIQGTDGNFYGVTTTGGTSTGVGCDSGISLPGCGTIFSLTPQGNLTTLYNSNLPDGYNTGQPFGDGPITSLLAGSDGNLYGTSQFGGSNTSKINLPIVCSFSDYPQGCGTFFQITPSGTITTLYSFCALASCADGYSPSGLIAGTDGNFYGFTDGLNVDAPGGTFFQVTPQGALTTIYTFPPAPGAAKGNQNFDQESHVQRNLPRLVSGPRAEAKTAAWRG